MTGTTLCLFSWVEPCAKYWPSLIRSKATMSAVLAPEPMLAVTGISTVPAGARAPRSATKGEARVNDPKQSSVAAVVNGPMVAGW